jgi:hypothetical protein
MLQLSRLLVAAYGERAAALARRRLPLHDTIFDALQQACVEANGSAGLASSPNQSSIVQTYMV